MIEQNLAHNNAQSGDAAVKAFKAIIQQAIYPEDHLDFSIAGLQTAIRTLQAYETSFNDQRGLIDLMLFTVECGTQVTLDYGDIEEDFYIALEEAWESALTSLKAAPDMLVFFQSRLDDICEATRTLDSYGYGDQIKYLLDQNFPTLFQHNPQQTSSNLDC